MFFLVDYSSKFFAVVLFLGFLAVASFASATVIINTTQIFPQSFFNSSNLTGQSFTFNVSNESKTLNIVNVTLISNFTGTWADNVSNASAVVNAQNFTLNLTGMTNGFFVWNLKVWAFDASATVSLTQIASNNTLIVDTIAPNVTTVNSPSNFVNASGQSITFNVTGKDNILLANASIYTNATGTWLRNVTNSSLTSINNNTPLLATVSNLPANVSFIWNMEVCDVVGNCAQYNANQTAIVDLTAPNVTTVNSPANNLNSSSQSITFNVTVKDNVQLANASIFHNATGVWSRNATNSSLSSISNNTPILVTVVSLPEGNRTSWIMEACDVAGNCAQYNANQTLIVDLTVPKVQIVNFTATNATDAFLNFSVSDANAINSVIVSLTRTGSTTNYSTATRFPAAASNTSGYYNISFSGLGYDTFTVVVYVNDTAGNANTSVSSSITISTGSSSSSSGGSGGSGSSSTVYTVLPPAATPSAGATATPSAGSGQAPSGTPAATKQPTSTPAATATPSHSASSAGAVWAASGAISSAFNGLDAARAKGLDVSAAENLLALAQQAQASGNYAQAQQYATQAQAALQGTAQAHASPTVTAAASSGPSSLVIGAVVLVLLGAGAYVLSQRGAKK